MSEQMTTKPRGQRQTRVGTVVGSKMDKTIVVAVTNSVVHRLYHRHMKRTSKLYAHDEQNQCNLGDEVQIESCRPLSRSKRWRLQKILKRAEGS